MVPQALGTRVTAHRPVDQSLQGGEEQESSLRAWAGGRNTTSSFSTTKPHSGERQVVGEARGFVWLRQVVGVGWPLKGKAGEAAGMDPEGPWEPRGRFWP